VDAADVARDGTIVSDGTSGLTEQIAGEVVEAGDELRPDDGLDFDFAEGLSHDPLGIFTENHQLLLDNLDRLVMADNSLGLRLGEGVVETTEVVFTVEVVETTQLGETSPVIEGNWRVAGALDSGRSKGGGGEGSDGRNRENGLGEHFDKLIKLTVKVKMLQAIS